MTFATVSNEESVDLWEANSSQIYALRRIGTVLLPAQTTDHSYNSLQILLRHQRAARQTEPPVEELHTLLLMIKDDVIVCLYHGIYYNVNHFIC